MHRPVARGNGVSPPVPRLLLAALQFAFGAGCTFLVSFDDVPDAAFDAAVPPVVTAPPRRDASPPPFDASVPDVFVPPSVPTCDLAFPLQDVKGCEAFVDDAKVCASKPQLTYPAGRNRAGDLVTCERVADGGRATCVKHCAGPGGCASLPNSFPDQCDTCTGLADGRYCGSELGWVVQNQRLLVTCGNDRIVTRTACTGSCTPNFGSALCR